MKKNSNKVAVITGAFGQDGKYLSSLLIKKKYDIIQIDKFESFFNNKPINHYNILLEKDIIKLISDYKIDEIYYLAAKVLSTEKRNIDEKRFNSLIENFNVNVKGYYFFIKNMDKTTKIFYPSSSYMFRPKKGRINESTIIWPKNLYGINKSISYWLSKFFRKRYNLFISVGILFNHESIYRPDTYITKKIVLQAKEIKVGKRKNFHVHNAKQLVDWGHAEDYVEAIYLIMQHNKADDFIISSGLLYSIEDFIKTVCKKMGINFNKNIINSKNSNKNAPYYFGNNKKILNTLEWKPKKKLIDIIEDLIK